MKDAQESLDFIKSLVNDNRKMALSSGMPSIVWGIVVMIALAFTYYGSVNAVGNGWYYMTVWLVISFLGWLLSYLVEKKREKCQISTYSQRVLGMIWLGHGSVMMILAFIGTVSGAISPFAVSPMMGTVLGSAYFINGYMNKYRWLQYVGIGWWIASIVLFFIVRNPLLGGAKTLLYFCGMMFFLQIVPGIKLEMLWRKENS
jgi:hypothetical protein